MVVTCVACEGGTSSSGGTCSVCGGDAEIDLTDANFKILPNGVLKALFGVCMDDIMTRLSDVEDKVDGVMDKCNDIKQVVDEL